MAADATGIHLTYYKEKISPEVKYCVHFTVVCYKNRTFATAARLLLTYYTVGKGRKCKRKGSWAAFNRRIHAYKDGMYSAYDQGEREGKF